MITPEKRVKRQQMESYFRAEAQRCNAQLQTNQDLATLFDKNDKKRVMLVLPESMGDIFIATALFESIRHRYPRPEWTFYFSTKPEYFELLIGNPYIDKVIPYHPQFDNLIFLEGQGDYKGLVDVAYLIYLCNQRMLSYLHNNIDTIDFKLEP